MRLTLAILLVTAVLRAAPQRIVSASPAVTETLFALGLGDRVVGVTDYSNYPPEAKKKPRIGGFLNPSIETIVALRPDLVITERGPSKLAAQLARLKVLAVEVDFKALPDILASFQKIAAAAGVAERGLALGNAITHELDQIRSRIKGSPRTRMMFVVGRTSGTLTGIIVVGGSSYLSELMAIAGGVNAFADSTAAYPKVNLEEVLARDPDVILDRADMGDQSAATEAQKRAVIDLWRAYPLLKAVKQERVVFGISDIFFVPGPRIVDAAQAFAKMFHPEVKW